MRISILKPILLLLCSLTLPICSYSEIVVEPNSQLTMDKSCLSDGTNNLTNCAAVPTEKIYEKIAPLKLNEEQVEDRAIGLL